MTSRRSPCRLAMLLVLALSACGRDSGSAASRAPESPTSTAPLSVQLGPLADEIDPGEQRPLFDEMPSDVAAVLGSPAPLDDAVLASPLAAWDALPAQASFGVRAVASLQVARVLVAVESSRPRNPHERLVRLFALEQLYSFFDQPVLASDRSMFGIIVAQAGRLAAEAGVSSEGRGLSLVSYALDAMRRAAALHRHTAAVLMREQPGDPRLADVLDRVARATGADHPERAVVLRRAGIELRGASVTGVQLVDFARACFVALDPECADGALARAKASGTGDAELAKRIAGLETVRATAAKVRASTNATTLEDRLARAQSLIELGRKHDAAEAHAALLAEHPDDARVVTAAARHALWASFDVEAGYHLIAAAPETLANRDRAYFEAAIGLRATHLGYVVIPGVKGGVPEVLAAIAPEYAELRADVVELERTGDDLGKVLRTLLEIGEGAVPLVAGQREHELLAYMRGLLPKGVALLDAAPRSKEAYRTAIGLALLSDDRRGVLDFAQRVVPEDESGTLALRHAELQLAIAVAWNDPARLHSVARELESLPAAVPATARARAVANLDAVRARLEGDTAARGRAIAAYRELLASSDAPDGAMLDNLAALLADTGDLVEAARLWRLHVEKAPDDSEYARLQLHAIGGGAADITALQGLAVGGSNEARIVAGRWLVQLAATPIERKRRLAQSKRTLAELHARSPKLDSLPGAAGVALTGTLEVGVSYTNAKGMTLTIEVARAPRLVWLPSSSARGSGTSTP